MDILGPALSVADMLLPSLTRRADSGALEATLRECAERALARALLAQDVDAAELPSAIVASIPPGEASAVLGRLRLGDDGDRDSWADAMASIIGRHGGVDIEADISRLCAEFSVAFGVEIQRAAAQPGSVIFQPFMVSQVSPRVSTAPPAPEDLSAARPSNLWELPLAPAPVARAELHAVEQILAQHPLVVVSGAAGAGKSTVARIIAERRAKAAEHPLVWWMSASSSEGLNASCDALLREIGAAPADDASTEVRRILAGHDSWFVVLDDVVDEELIGAVIPNGARAGSVIVTTRNAALRSAGETVALVAADGETMRDIARSLLPPAVGPDDIDELVDACAGHPLALATSCRFLTATGTSVAELSALLRTQPSAVLSETVGPHYRVSFDEVIARSLQELGDGTALMVLLAVASGGGIAMPRDLLAAALPLTGDALRSGIRRLGSLGLVEFNEVTVACHGLVSALVLDRVEDAADVVTHRLLTTIGEQALSTEPSRLRELVSILNAVSRQAPDGASLGARAILAESLAAHGLIRSALEQIDFIKERIPADLSVDDRAHLALFEARVQLHAGDYVGTREAAERGIRAAADAGLDWVRASCLVALAWCHDALGDRTAALRDIQEAAECAPDDLGVQSLLRGFEITERPRTEQVDEYVALAEDTRLTPEARAQYYGMASRVATRLGRSDDAIDYARQALQLDRASAGDRTQVVARDLNDLGMALLDAGELDEAEQALRESIEVYEQELSIHPMGVLPRTHLGRLLVLRSWGVEGGDPQLLAEAQSVLEPAVRVQQATAPESADFAAALIALADAVHLSDSERAEQLIEQALEIDRKLYGDADFETGVDVLKLMELRLNIGKAAEALRVFAIVRSAVPEWEQQHPELAAQLLVLQVKALLGIGVVGGVPRITPRLEALRVDPRLRAAHVRFVEECLREAYGSGQYSR